MFTFDWLMINKKRLKIKWYAALALSVLHVLLGVGCVKLFALAEAGFNPLKAGSMSLFGAVFFLPAAYFAGAKLFKRSVADVFDVFTVPMVFTLFCARINCLASGCCLGIVFGESGFRCPTREIELAFYLVFLIAVSPMVYKSRGGGRAFPLFMLAYGAFRFVIEFFRENESIVLAFHLSHAWALLSFAAGMAICLLVKNNSRRLWQKSRRSD